MDHQAKCFEHETEEVTSAGERTLLASALNPFRLLFQFAYYLVEQFTLYAFCTIYAEMNHQLLSTHNCVSK